jgi:hypothetical protein
MLLASSARPSSLASLVQGGLCNVAGNVSGRVERLLQMKDYSKSLSIQCFSVTYACGGILIEG